MKALLGYHMSYGVTEAFFESRTDVVHLYEAWARINEKYPEHSLPILVSPAIQYVIEIPL